MIETLSPVLLGTLASLGAGMMTALGGVPILVMRRPSAVTQSVLLGFAAGVMLAASFFSLIIPGVAALEEGGSPRAAAAGVMALAVLLGAAAVGVLNRKVPVDMFSSLPPGQTRALARRIWLFVIAITLHNFPEGMAVGVSVGGGGLALGLPTAIGIGIQNVPEGLAVAAAFITLGHSRWIAFAGALASGLVEPVGGLVGAAVVSSLPDLLPWGLGLAAGAMIYVVTAEIIPHNRGEEGDDRSMVGLMIGLVGMMFLDVALG